MFKKIQVCLSPFIKFFAKTVAAIVEEKNLNGLSKRMYLHLEAQRSRNFSALPYIIVPLTWGYYRAFL